MDSELVRKQFWLHVTPVICGTATAILAVSFFSPIYKVIIVLAIAGLCLNGIGCSIKWNSRRPKTRLYGHVIFLLGCGCSPLVGAILLSTNHGRWEEETISDLRKIKK